jgi:hypothetical protein
MGICVWSPRLDEHGNSVRGIEFCRKLAGPGDGEAGGEIEPAGAGGAVVISAVAGMAGVGKTALAVHWAHKVAGRFPDGQLYVNLRGYDAEGAPVTPRR